MLTKIFKMLFVIVIHITVLNSKKIHYILVIETGQNKGRPGTNMIYQTYLKRILFPICTAKLAAGI